MDILGFVSVPDWLIWNIIIVVALYIYGTRTFSLYKYGYNGPKPTPFIGNINLLINSGHFAQWDTTGRKLYGKVFWMYEGSQPTIVVFDTDILKEVMVKQFNNFVDRRRMYFRGPVMEHSLVDVEGDVWRRIRNLTTPFFTTSKLRRNISFLDFCCQNLIRKCEATEEKNEPLDVRAVAGAFTLEAICLMAFGLQVDSQQNPDNRLLKTVRKIMDYNLNYWGFWVGFIFPEVVPYLDKLGCCMFPKGTMDVLRELAHIAIEERRKSNKERPDFIQAMLNAHNEDTEKDRQTSDEDDVNVKSMSEDEIVSQVALFALAGYDTTGTGLSFLLYNMASNPECQEKLFNEIQDVVGDQELTYDVLKKMVYLDMCLDESLRLFPPVFRTERKCLADITIKGHFIPKDTLVIIPIHGLQHDPELWKDPYTYNPERFSPANKPDLDMYGYQVFGTGLRNCVGMRLAQIEIKMVAISILQKFKIGLSEKTKTPIKLEHGFFPRVEGGLYLKLEKRPS